MTDERFLSRWSRLKRDGANPATADALPLAENTPAPSATVTEAAPPPLTLDDVAKLGPDGDFSRFLSADVAPDVHRAALRKLWASDPIITTHDGLTDYAEDFSFDPNAAPLVRTIWNAGRNIVGAQDVGAQDIGAQEGENARPLPRTDTPPTDTPPSPPVPAAASMPVAGPEADDGMPAAPITPISRTDAGG